jgi:hypothetical protein
VRIRVEEGTKSMERGEEGVERRGREAMRMRGENN